MPRCVAYCRVSKDSKDQRNSLKNQIGHYTDLFEKEGYQGADCGVYYSKEGRAETFTPIKSIFADEGISGTKLKNREAFKRMIDHATRKDFDAIYVKNIQRFARNVEDGSGILKKLKLIGVKVIFEDGCLNNFDDEMVINILLSAAQEESRSKGRAVQFGLHHAQKQGKWTAGEPYGYHKENAMLVPIAAEIEVVREIFSLYLAGLGCGSIAKRLNTEGKRTRKGLPWYPTLVFDIIQNPIYIGKHITHRFENTDVNVESLVCNGVKFNSQKATDASEWIVTDREDLRAVDDECFYAAQEERKKRADLSSRKNRPSTKHLFSNLLRCHGCNQALRRKKLWGWKRKDGSRKMGVEWVCAAHDLQHAASCPFRNSWREEELITQTRMEINRVIADPRKLDDLFEQYVQLFLTNERSPEQAQAWKEELEETNEACTTILLLLTRKVIGEEQFRQQNTALQARKRDLETLLHRYKTMEAEISTARRKHDAFKQNLHAIDPEHLDNTMLKKIFHHIEAYTFTDEKNLESKGLHFVWNVADRSEDDIHLKKALETIQGDTVGC